MARRVQSLLKALIGDDRPEGCDYRNRNVIERRYCHIKQ
nr:hypothetical protein [Kibdelosporangium sp. MJ126-NF4]CTQ98103.1 hypothetical protein [Kibdelosporangium sp. MJ126-NF4]